jgi:hypothetical protein
MIFKVIPLETLRREVSKNLGKKTMIIRVLTSVTRPTPSKEATRKISKEATPIRSDGLQQERGGRAGRGEGKIGMVMPVGTQKGAQKEARKEGRARTAEHTDLKRDCEQMIRRRTSLQMIREMPKLPMRAAKVVTEQVLIEGEGTGETLTREPKTVTQMMETKAFQTLQIAAFQTLRRTPISWAQGVSQARGLEKRRRCRRILS